LPASHASLQPTGGGPGPAAERGPRLPAGPPRYRSQPHLDRAPPRGGLPSPRGQRDWGRSGPAGDERDPRLARAVPPAWQPRPQHVSASSSLLPFRVTAAGGRIDTQLSARSSTRHPGDPYVSPNLSRGLARQRATGLSGGDDRGQETRVRKAADSAAPTDDRGNRGRAAARGSADAHRLAQRAVREVAAHARN
jgi:hypothetical protein